MLTNEDLVKVSLIAVAASLLAPVAIEVRERWRTAPPRFWARWRRSWASRKGLPW